MENTMLIVDDSEMNRDILKLLFHDEYTILEAETGREALEVMESCKGNVDIVLLDLIMSDINGLTVLERRRELEYFKDVPVVVITGSGELDDQIRAFELGANDYVNKPFIPEIVISRVNNVMSSHRRMLSIELEAEKLKVKSELDQMTGLYNKVTAEYTIDEILQSHPEQTHALLLIDIDNFKSVNDMSGHLAGDHTIRIVADLISSLFRKTDIVGRIGGDEYIVLMVDVESMDIVRTKVNELIQLMKYKPNLTIPENVTLSIGFASSNGEPTSYHELFEKVDEALYIAKESGKARYQEYGVEPVTYDDDSRPAVLLLSRNRSVCSVVHAMVPPQLRILEVLSLHGLSKLKKDDIEKIALCCIDVSDKGEDGKAVWSAVKAFHWTENVPLLAICEEGNLEQYKVAMIAEAADILSAPLEGAAFKRRIMKLLQKNIMIDI